MKSLFAVFFASTYGLTIRMLFGFFSESLEIMSVTFIGLMPFVIGFVTVILLPKDSVKTRISAFFMPWLTCVVLLLVTVIFGIEGMICWIMIFPVFAILAGFGGLVAFQLRKPKDETKKKDYGPDILNVSFLLFIPMFLGFLEGDRTSIPKNLTITEEVVIPAPASQVWHEITHIGKVVPQEKHSFATATLGFPQHLITTLDKAQVGGKRMAYYEKGLYFEETITQYEEGRLLKLDVHVDPHKVPPTVMDEHILIGGKHLDVLEDTYTLTELPNGHTRLSLSSRFYINTSFNWYSTIWAKYLMSDILESEIELIKKRCGKGK